MEEAGNDIIGGIFGLLGKKIDADAARDSARATFDAGGPLYGVDELGRPYYRGAPTGYAGGIPPIAIVGVGVVAVVLLVAALKS